MKLTSKVNFRKTYLDFFVSFFSTGTMDCSAEMMAVSALS